MFTAPRRRAMFRIRRYSFFILLLIAVGTGTALLAQAPKPAAPAQMKPAAHITSPKEEWGHNVADDYFEADYQQLIKYWHKLEQESPRLHVVEIGKTAEGRP